MMKPLDPFQIDLEKTTLIEASAGTGKTYTITTLFCRLVASGYPVESILVVTFTEAAAAELTLRIRERLSKTLTGISGDNLKNLSSSQSDDTEDELVQFFCCQKDLPLIRQRLQLALICFDQTSIMTIHSFCFKILKEAAFECRSLFDIELAPDRALFLRQVSFDFFMGHVNPLDKLFLSYLSQKQITPQSIADSFQQVVSKPGLLLKPPDAIFENIFDEYRQTLEKIHDILLHRAGEIIEVIQGNDGIDKRSYTKKYIPAWLEASRIKLDQEGVDTLLKMTEKGDALYKFTKTRLATKTKPEHIPPEHEFFDLCEQMLSFYEVFENNLICLKIKFLAFFNAELDKLKKTQGICFFDDLVNDLAAALEDENAVDLIAAVRKTYKACLIDEFQDTDPRQYDIFSKLFSSRSTPFFMIGDPKQAIYAFRGGDIFAYLKASQESDQQVTLEKNYRSAPSLVKGINEIFSSSPRPFLFNPIEFLKVTTPATAKNILVRNKAAVPPVQVCFFSREDQVLDKGFIKKETATEIIPKLVAKDILSLLQSADLKLTSTQGPSLEVKKINPEDIAVLVRTNLQAEQIQRALSACNIPSYLSQTGSVFESRQAIDLHDILWAVMNPDHKGSIKAALCTLVFNFSSGRLLELDTDEALFFVWQDRFREYKEIWKTKGFVSMIMTLFHSDDAFLKTNLQINERELTNFYHLVELISQASLKQQLSPYYLLKWYARQLFKDLRDDFSDELRLESDKKAVTIVTIHKSKGLEYPIVYLPYLWEGVRNRLPDNILFHDPHKDDRLTLDLGSNDMEASQDYFKTEEAAEHRRLLYVAMTRASALCKIIWGGVKTVETSALGMLLHSDDCKDDQSMRNDLEQLQKRAPQSILVQSCRLESAGYFSDRTDSPSPVLSAQKMTREIKAVWKMSSFSAISHSQSPEPFQRRETSDESGTGPLITLANFPKGAGSGDLFHSMFEILDFTKGSGEISQSVQSRFDRFGFSGRELMQMAETSVRQVLETRLTSDASEFCLKDIRSDQRFNEMEFTFPIHSLQVSSIRKIFEQSDPKFKTSGYLEKLSQLTPQAINGFLKGFIDLIIHHEGKWYMIDYKSNYLGDTYDQYSQDAMFDAMSDHHYFLQYHLYLVALHRYLALRVKDYDYDTHFGGIFYLFIRGMHPDFGSQYGVFFDRPAKAVINSLSD